MRNKKLIRSVVTIAILLICHGSYAQKEINNNKKLVERWFKYIGAHDTVALASMYADTAFIESPNWEGTKRGPAAIREIYSRYFRTSPDLIHTLTSVFTADNSIVIEYTFSGTMEDPEKGSP